MSETPPKMTHLTNRLVLARDDRVHREMKHHIELNELPRKGTQATNKQRGGQITVQVSHTYIKVRKVDGGKN